VTEQDEELALLRQHNERLLAALEPFARLDIEGSLSGFVLTGTPRGMCSDITREDVIRAHEAMSWEAEWKKQST
jgi:hypothetical protein